MTCFSITYYALFCVIIQQFLISKFKDTQFLLEYNVFWAFYFIFVNSTLQIFLSYFVTYIINSLFSLTSQKKQHGILMNYHFFSTFVGENYEIDVQINIQHLQN